MSEVGGKDWFLGSPPAAPGRKYACLAAKGFRKKLGLQQGQGPERWELGARLEEFGCLWFFCPGLGDQGDSLAHVRCPILGPLAKQSTKGLGGPH